MSAIHLEWNPVEQQLESLRALVEELRREVGELRGENAELRREVGYWQSMHARAVERNTKQQSELEEAKAQIRQLKAERFGKKTEKQSATDRTNRLDDSNEKKAPKKKRGRQPGSPVLREMKCACCTRDYPELKDWALAWLLGIRELYCLNRERLRHAPGTSERAAAEFTLRQQVATMAAQRDSELAVKNLREPCRKVLESLTDHWTGLTLFVNDPRIPMDNNYGERLIRGPAVGRKNYYGSGAEWSGRLSMMLFSIFSTLSLRKINSRRWLNWYFEACANSGGKAPDDVAEFLPWNFSADRLSELQNSIAGNSNANSS